SGVSVRLNVLPGWPFCPPVFLPDRSRRFVTRTGFFFSPSLDGGLPLLPLFSPSRRSSSAMRARSSAISACCAAMTASGDAGLGGTGAAASCESESVGGHMGSLTHAPTRVSSADQRSATWAVTRFLTFETTTGNGLRRANLVQPPHGWNRDTVPDQMARTSRAMTWNGLRHASCFRLVAAARTVHEQRWFAMLGVTEKSTFSTVELPRHPDQRRKLFRIRQQL